MPDALSSASAPDLDTRRAVAALLAEAGVEVGTEGLVFEPVAGGVSAELWRARSGEASWCVKRPRERLRTERLWRAPRARAGNEVRWLAAARAVEPELVPAVLGYDATHELFVMADHPPPAWVPWKTQLLAGEVDEALARALGAAVGRIHAATALRPELAERFPDRLFQSLRVEPFFRALAPVHPDLAPVLEAREALLRSGPRALVHGDVSPKNVLVGPGGRILLLDAECACWGLPAFDAAFPVHHLLLKGALRPERLAACCAAAGALLDAWHGHAGPAAGDDADERIAALVPLLLLARVDGTSPVDYLDTPTAARVRTFARTQLRRPAPGGTAQLLERWERALGPLDP